MDELDISRTESKVSLQLFYKTLASDLVHRLGHLFKQTSLLSGDSLEYSQLILIDLPEATDLFFYH